MNRTEAMAWALSICLGFLRKSQAKTLSTLVAGALKLERLSLILALAYLLLAGLGLLAQRRYRSGRWASTNRVGECSVFQIGNRMLEELAFAPALAMAAVVLAAASQVPKWG